MNPSKEELAQQPYWKEDMFLLYEQKFIEAKVILKQRLDAIQPPASASIVPSSAAASHSVTAPLPKLPLPKFSGEQLDWDTFKERFTSMVINVPAYSKVTKLQYLQSCLEGSAARRLNNLEVTSANFDVAWAGLVKRYDNSRVRLSAHLSKILSLPTTLQKSAAGITSLLDEVDEALRALRSLGRPIDHWDDWLIEIITSRLTGTLREDWEKTLEGKEGFPTYAQLVQFLEGRARTLEAAQSTSACQQKPIQCHKGQRSVSSHHSATKNSGSQPSQTRGGCGICKGDHFVSFCPTFAKSELAKRMELVSGADLCVNCLSKKHAVAKCTSKGRCRIAGCGRKHHTMLHSYKASGIEQGGISPGTADNNATTSYTTQLGGTRSDHCTSTRESDYVVILPTAWIILESLTGTSARVRALLDHASEGSFISERVAQMLSLKRQKGTVTVSGVGGQANLTSNSCAEVIVKSPKKTDFSLQLSAMILGNLTKLLPTRTASSASRSFFQDLDLADQRFFEPGRIDCILGGDVYHMLLQPGLRLGSLGQPAAQQTVMGWVVTGPTPPQSITAHLTSTFSFHTTTATICEDLRRFWEIEEVSSQPQLTQKELDCEKHYTSTQRRNEDGRYVLRLPFTEPPVLGDSKKIALARFLQSERRLLTKPAAKLAYSKFIGEMISLGHMERVPDSDLHKEGYFMPQHAVVKQDGSGRIKVVSNASQASSNGRSLNDFLHTGQKLQADIVAVLLQWRTLLYVFSTDIVKMFRQFLLDESDRDWLRVLWRESPQEQLQAYRMRTVVYGTACAPFQAIRTLHQLASEVENASPRAAHILRNQMYMDDALAGADSLQEAQEAKSELIASLKSAGMQLDKWAANHPSLLVDLPTTSNAVRVFAEDDVVSTLGLQWNPVQDFFSYKVTLPPPTSRISKRVMLSEVARLYDPLGWLAPVTIIGKILIQRLWISGHDWDQEVSDEVRNHWITLRDQLPHLEALRIPRWVGTRAVERFFLHGFADASSLAYAAAIYLVVKEDGGQPRSTLLVAKTKVAPIKTVSIPRLELCGAQLLARLMDNTVKQLRLRPQRIYCWLDSQVALAWLDSHPSRWTTFVANRVSDILTTLPNGTWQHVRTTENPADLASRGAMPLLIADYSLWWHGPTWLIDNYGDWTIRTEVFTTGEEEKKEVLSFLTPLETEAVEQLFERFSSWTKLIRVVAFVLRWKRKSTSQKPRARVQPLIAEELQAARRVVITVTQRQYYLAEVNCISANRPPPTSSKLRRFLPFVDADGLLRVGGRLQNTFLGDNEKHPIIIPCESHVAELLIRDAHLQTLHGGPQLVQSHLLRTFWIVRSRNRIRQLTRRCVRCRRFQGLRETQQMAPLPLQRVTPTRPFSRTGLDYAGLFQLRTTKGRGHKSYKGYVCVFICLVTRAVHLEVVSDLSAQAFLSAFRRFTARRGLCRELLSDNGTNFQGACAELQRLFNAASSFYAEAFESLAATGVSWKFIPPRAPHFGGLWEAAVKSFKRHLRRVLGDATLTYEEFSTLTTQIEGCLNSRPLCPLSSDPMDVAALTPGHFLIGAALTSLPEPFEPQQPGSTLSRYHLVTDMRNHFWKRWHGEVLRLQQQRSKWLDPNESVKEGDLVLVTDELQPPTKWPLARVLQLHLGADGLARVLTLRTATTTLRRPLVKLVKLLGESVEDTASARHLMSPSAVHDSPGSSMAGGAGAPALPSDGDTQVPT